MPLHTCNVLDPLFLIQSLGSTTLPDLGSWLYYAVGAMATLVIGIGKAGFGGGVGIVAVPLLALVLPIDTVLGVLLPLLLAGDILSIGHHWGKQSRPHVRWLGIGSACGFCLGAVLLSYLQHSTNFIPILNLTVGGICLGFVGLQVYRLLGGVVPRFSEHPLIGSSVGLLATFVSTLAHAAGPLVSLYLLDQRLDKYQIVATNLLVFFWVNLAKLVTYIGLGLITAASLVQSLIFLPCLPIGTVLGVWLHKRIPERPFMAVLYAGAAVAAGRLIYATLG